MDDRAWLENYAKGGSQGGFQLPKPPARPKKKEDDEEPSKFYQQRRTQDSGDFPRPRLGGMTVR